MTISRIQIPPEIYLSSSKVYVCQNNIFVLDMLKGNVINQHKTSYTSNFILENDTMYLIQNNGTLLQALSAISGLLLWHFQVENDFLFPPSFGDSVMYIGTREGFLYCLELNSGSLLWSKELKKILLTKIAIFNKTIYLACKNLDEPLSSICALSADDGSLLWEIPTPHSTVWPLSISEEILYVSMPTSCYAMSTAKGKLLWKQDIGKDINFSPLLHADLLYLCCFEPHYLFSTLNLPPEIDHRPWITALHKSDGHPLWQKQLGIGTHAKVARSLACASGAIFATTDDGYISAMNDRDGSTLWRSKTPGTLSSTPKIMNEAIYVGVNDGSVCAFQIDDGSLLWHTSIGNGLSLGFVDAQL